MTTTALTLAPSATDFASAHASVQALSADLNRAFVERAEVVRALLVALIAGEHVALLGDPGTGKSAITNALCKAIGGRSFAVLMTKFSVPEEVFGPISLAGLEQDRYQRVTTGMLPEAQVAFLDEVFKANSAILNALLTLVNERSFDNGGQRVKVPLEILVGASNEMPQDESLGALWDRFLLRLWVSPVRNRDALRGLLRQRSEPSVTATLSRTDLETLRAAADSAVIPDDVLDVILDLRDALAQEHGITASDRRWRKAIKLVAAHAVLSGRVVADRADVMILADSLWRNPEERAKVLGTMARIVSPDLATALQILDAAHELLAGVDVDKAQVGDSKDANGKAVLGLAKINERLREMLATIRKLDQIGGVDEITAKVADLHVRVARATRTRLGL